MEVVAGLIAFLGLPAGLLIARLTPSEKKEFASLRIPLLRLCASAAVIVSAYALTLPFAHVIALLSLLLLFFNIPSALIFSLSPVLLFLSRSSTLSYIPLGFVLLYALLAGIGLGPAANARALLPYTPYLALTLLVYSL